MTRFERGIQAAIPPHPQAPLLTAWHGPRDLHGATAAAVVAEFGNPSPFRHPRAMMSHVGVVPTAASRGPTDRRVDRRGVWGRARGLAIRPEAGRLARRNACMPASGASRPNAWRGPAVARELCGSLWDMAVWVHVETAREAVSPPTSS
ncbi:MAG: transposase [Thermaerobacter sp.]|nr:transposase [Thermaerobacter sp.]